MSFVPSHDNKAALITLRNSENNYCINCLSKSPFYVCLDFGTFICAKCASIHCSLHHNVRSINLSNFTDTEVENIRRTGNKVASLIWFGKWDENNDCRPSPDDTESLRSFISNVYIKKVWKREDRSNEMNAIADDSMSPIVSLNTEKHTPSGVVSLSSTSPAPLTTKSSLPLKRNQNPPWTPSSFNTIQPQTPTLVPQVYPQLMSADDLISWKRESHEPLAISYPDNSNTSWENDTKNLKVNDNAKVQEEAGHFPSNQLPKEHGGQVCPPSLPNSSTFLPQNYNPNISPMLRQTNDYPNFESSTVPYHATLNNQHIPAHPVEPSHMTYNQQSPYPIVYNQNPYYVSYANPPYQVPPSYSADSSVTSGSNFQPLPYALSYGQGPQVYSNPNFTDCPPLNHHLATNSYRNQLNPDYEMNMASGSSHLNAATSLSNTNVATNQSFQSYPFQSSMSTQLGNAHPSATLSIMDLNTKPKTDHQSMAASKQYYHYPVHASRQDPPSLSSNSSNASTYSKRNAKSLHTRAKGINPGEMTIHGQNHPTNYNMERTLTNISNTTSKASPSIEDDYALALQLQKEEEEAEMIRAANERISYA